MKIQNEQMTLALDRAAIDAISEKLSAFLSLRKLERREVSRYTLTAEEILLGHFEKTGGNAEVTLSVGSRLGIPFFTLAVSGQAYDVFAAASDENGALNRSVLRNLGLTPEYVYKNNVNTYSFRIARKNANPFITLLIALAAAGIIGFAGLLLPDAARAAMVENVFDPLHNTFLNVLGCLAGPMVFLSVAWGIYGIGDAATLKKIGKKLLLYNTLTVYICLILGGLIAMLFFRFDYSAGEGAGGAAQIFTMLLDIIPRNIVSPFADGNTLQIIFMAMIFGIAMLFLGQKTTAVARAIEQINYIIQFIIEFISRLVPYFIFIVIVSMIWSSTASVISGVGKLFLIFALTVISSETFIIARTAIRNRISPLQLIRKGLPTLIIALTTASSAAAFGSNIKACRDEYGIDSSVSSFGIPMGMVTFKPNTSLNYLAVAVFFAQMYNVKISASWVVILLFTCGILALATPPIPGGAMTAYTVLFAQLGIPAEALVITLACDAVFDFIDTGFDQFSIPLVLLDQASRMGLVDRDVLYRKSSGTFSALIAKNKK